jgi:hypothetical protein
MSKKIMLFAAMAISAALAVPAMAFAVEEDVALHIVPKPAVASTVSGGVSVLSSTNGNTVTCEKVKGSANWESTTTGTLNLTFEGNCKAHIEPETNVNCSSITTGTLPFHLVTVPGAAGKPHVPGVLITKPAAGPFAKFTCSIFPFEVLGNGIVGTITSPACGAEAESATIKFETTEPGMSKHKEVVSTGNPERTTTPTKYNLTQGGSESAMTATGTVQFAQKHKLECT